MPDQSLELQKAITHDEYVTRILLWVDVDV